jgi:phosphomannomutase/phosphoglucomutase
MDGRLSSPDLKKQTISGLSKSGCNVIDLGLNPTPILYFGSHNLNADGAIQITGSHNPKNYNGVKLVINDKPVSGVEILQLIDKEKLFSEDPGQITFIDIREEYIQEVKKNIHINSKIKVVIDCGNGAAGCIAPQLFKKLGCEVIELFSEVDGNFPNHHPDPGKIENLSDLISKVEETKADLGLAFDGDGDRVGLVTNLGKIVFPDKIMMLLSKDILATKKGSIIFDVKCSNSLADIISDNGGEPIMSPTGHFHIKNNIKKYDPLLAGEMSGHIFFNDKWYGFDDGHYSGARIIELISKNNRSISELENELPLLYSTPELNIDMADDKKFKIIEDFSEQCSLNGEKITIDGLRISFDNGWGLLRASNTTPKLVLRFEGDSIDDLNQIKDDFLNELSRICPDIDINLV